MRGSTKVRRRRAGGGSQPLSHLTADAWVRVLRPRDLLSFEVSWTGLTLGRGRGAAKPPVLKAGAQGGLLKVRWPFQHVAEIASLVKDNGEPFGALPAVPVPARAAHRSRLVFKVPAGSSIDFTIEGLLEAMSTLEMAVAPVARPAPPPKLWYLSGTSSLEPLLQLRLATLAGARVRGRTVKAAPVDLLRASLTATRLAGTGALGRLGPIEREIAVTGPVRVVDPVRPPKAGETAIEAPYRLILSPSKLGAWVHAFSPVAAPADPNRVELWHSRLAVRRDSGPPDEVDPSQRIVRAIWTRDRERPSDAFDYPFRQSLDRHQRMKIVRQSSGASGLADALLSPIQANRLALTALGASLDLAAQWPFRKYPVGSAPLASWEHIAPFGRDQWVKVVEPLASYPPGHDAYLITITYRAIHGKLNPQARLFQYQRVVRGNPWRDYDNRDLPFVSIRLDPEASPYLNPIGYWNAAGERLFIPVPLGSTNPFLWDLTGFDHDGKPKPLKGALVFYSVPASEALRTAAESLYRTAKFDGVPINRIPANGQVIAFAPNAAAGGGSGPQASTGSETDWLLFDGSAGPLDATPRLEKAQIVPAVARQMSRTPPAIEVKYPAAYLASGFGAANKGQVYLESLVKKPLEFGSSERSGGFVRPDVQIGGLSRINGIVGDVGQAAAGTFDPASLLQGLNGARLFGLVELSKLIPGGLLDKAPTFAVEELDQATALLRDGAALRKLAQEQGLAAAGPIAAAIGQIESSVAKLVTNPGDAAAKTALTAGAGNLIGAAGTLSTQAATLGLGPRAAADLARIAGAIAALNPASLVTGILKAIGGENPGGAQVRARLEWRTPLKSWGLAPGKDILVARGPGGQTTELVVSVETRTAPDAKPRVDVAAELSAFHLLLVPDGEMMRVKFDRLAFRTSAGRKPEVDVVFGGLEWLGILGFVESLQSLIPLDGFSDPPFVEVSPDGARAGFTVALPNLAIGIFSLTNLSLGADARIPFLGDVVSVGFNFCTRERPFTLAVAFLGGGGFFGIRIGPNGVVLLEAALEFGACLALDFGVASGSVSAMAGIYFRLESDKGSLTGYFRIRGEVDVLSLITASIELYMALTYAFDTGKMVGEAKITVKVEILFLSTSVSISARRQFAGSAGDPTVRQMLAPSGRPIDEIWTRYCAAFAAAGA